MNPNLKGNIAEAVIAAEATKLGIAVFRPQLEHGRVDLVFELGKRLLRVQCKWARLSDDGSVVIVSSGTSRRGANGYIRSTYGDDEVDLLAAYCGELDRCFLLPPEVFAGQSSVQLRIAAALNCQRVSINLAADYEFPGAVAQLEERRNGIAKARGSSPLSSILVGADTDRLGADEFGKGYARFLQRAAAGEEFVIFRRGKPMARLGPVDRGAPLR